MATMLSDIQMRQAILRVPNMPDHKVKSAYAALADIISAGSATALELQLWLALETEMIERGFIEK